MSLPPLTNPEIYPLQCAMDAIRAFAESSDDPATALIAAKCVGLMGGYDARWLHAPYEVIGAEELLTGQLWNPDTNRYSRSFTTAGKIDVRLRDSDGRRLIIDHKTTSEDIADQNSPYWRQLQIDAQPTTYWLLEWQNGQKIDGAIWDVVRKPSINPKKLDRSDLNSVLHTSRYFGTTLDSFDIQQVAETGRETLTMYGMRLQHDCTHERPDWYFARRLVLRLDDELVEAAREQWDNGQEILQARRNQRWPKSPGACVTYRSPCPYMGICSGHDEPTSENWKRLTNVHVELPGLEGDGRDVLTHSRLRMFQTCRQKHYFRYELGIDRVDAEEREALIFGNCWHAAQEAWFNAIREVREGKAYV